VSALEDTLAALATLETAAAISGVRKVWADPPPELAAVLPAIVNEAIEGEWEEPGFGSVPTGLQRETDTVEISVYSDQDDPARARRQLLPIKEALRTLINTHKTLSSTCRLARVTAWRTEVLTYAETEYHGLVVTVRVRFDLAGNFAA
jgi:hypothetical protein